VPLQHLLYRCPECGHDPAEATEEGARCPACDARFMRTEGAAIRVVSPEGERVAGAPELVDAIDRWEVTDPSGFVDGKPDYGARVRFRKAVGQGTAWERGRVSGFYEQFTERVRGDLRVSPDGLTLRDESDGVWEWGWSQIRAVQTSSRSVQINLHPGGLFDLAFEADSPRRWEGLIHRALRRHYAGRGLEVLEFQPRIVTRDAP